MSCTTLEVAGVARVAVLVMELKFLPDAGHDAVEDEGKGSSDDSEEQVGASESAPIHLGTTTTDDLSLANRSLTSAHDVGPGKTKRWRANMGGILLYVLSISADS